LTRFEESPPLKVDPKERLYLGRDVLVSVLRSEHICDLYPRAEVEKVLRAYRPWYEQTGANPQMVAERLDWLSHMEPPAEFEALVQHRSSGVALGFLSVAGLDPVNQKAEFSAAFFRGRGSRPALEAMHWAIESIFGPLNVEKLIFNVMPDNVEALHLLSRLGIPLEARLISEIRAGDGQRSDLLRFSLFREAWLRSSCRERLRRIVPLVPPVNENPTTV
jgi:RimJ/RimL family protein N-acetyltransferase